MALTKVSSGLMKPDNNLELEYTSQLGTTSVVGAATGYVVRTNYYDANVTAGSGATFKFTGVTTLGKAGNVPNADGYFYDAVGRQFAVVGSPVSPLWFGAVGDGVADDTAAIYILLQQQGDMYFDGLFRIEGSTVLSVSGVNYLEILSDTNIKCSEATEFRIESNQLADGTRFEITGSRVTVESGTFKETNSSLIRANVYGTISGAGCSQVHIINVAIDGSNGAGMHFRENCLDVTLNRPRVINTKSDGIHVQRGSGRFSINEPYCVLNEDDCIGLVSHGRNEGFGPVSDIQIIGGYLASQANGAVGSGIGIIGAVNCTVIGAKCISNGLSNIRITDYVDAIEGNYAPANILIDGVACYNGGVTTSGLAGLSKDGITLANCRNVKIVNADIINPVNSGLTLSNASIDVHIINTRIREAGSRGLWVAANSKTDAHILELANGYGDSRYSAATSLACEHLLLQDVDIQTSYNDGCYIDGVITTDVKYPTFKNIKAAYSNISNTAGKYGIFFSDTVDMLLDGADGGLTGSATAITSIVFVSAGYKRINNLASNYVSTSYPVRTRGIIREFWNSAAPVTGPVAGPPYALGELVWNSNPASGTTYWVCTATGAPGTWSARA